ncbi:MAG: TonB-dependent receptor [Oceanipulchritudo sp.]
MATFYTLSGMPDSFVQEALPGVEESKDLTPEDFEEGVTNYNYQESTGFIPKTRNSGFYTRLSYQVNPNLEAYLESSFRRVETRINAASTPLFSWNENIDLNLVPENPYNPFGEEMFIGWRMIEYGVRENIVQSDTPRIVAGLTGDIGETGWTFDTGFLFTESTVTNENANTVFEDRLQEALQTGVDFDGEIVWANPFGKNDPRIVDYVRNNNPTQDSFELWSYDLSANGDLFDLETGVVSAAVGAEYRYEELTSIRTHDNRTGNIVGGSQSESVFGDRDITSVYAELSIPVYDLAEFQVAGRYEDYSDFGDTSKPKLGVKVTPMDGVLLRGSFGQSFRAPDLPLLYSSGSVSFTSNFYTDPLRPDDPEGQIKNVGGGNPDLQPEETDSYYLGAQFDMGEINDTLDGLVVEIDYWEFEQTDVFGRFTPAQIIQNAGDPFFDQFIVRADPTQSDIDAGLPGTLLFVETDWQNLDEQSTSGVDLAVAYSLRTENYGQWRFKVEGTYVDEFKFSTLDFDEDGNEITVTEFFEGTWTQPNWRANGTIAWDYGDWAASLFIDFIGEYEQGAAEDQEESGNVKAYWRFNPQVAYSGLWDTTITVGVRNVFDEAPPLDVFEVTNVNVGLHNAEPRFAYIRLSKDW